MCDGISRRNFLKGSIIGGVALGAGAEIYELAYAQTTSIRFSTWQPPVSREVKTVLEPMLEEMKKRSGGKMASTMYSGSALGKGPEHFDIVAKGLSDMGYFTATWTPGRFPLSDVLSLASWVDGKDIATDIGNAMYDRILNREFKDVKMIQLNGCTQSFLWTKKPIRSLADTKGMKIRSPGGHQTHYIKSLGAEPIFMPLGDVYLAIEMGTIDGLVTCPPLILAYRLHEVAKHGVVATFGCVTEGIVMNLESWRKLPEELKKIVETVGHNPFQVTGGLTREVYKTMVKEISDKGVNLYNLPPNEAERWYEGFREVTRKWAADLEGKGLPAKEAVKMYNQECEKRGVKVVAFPPEWK
jgi:TRAP-type C4-dicarboxylate transport system substrate-binding protein